MADLKQNPRILLSNLKGLVNGLETAPPGGVTEVSVGGKAYSMPALLAQLGVFVALFQAVEDDFMAYQLSLQAREAQEGQAKLFHDQVRRFVKAALGNKNPNLADYAITPDKAPRPLTVEETTTKVARGKATRKARNTLGKRQKQKVKGQVPAA